MKAPYLLFIIIVLLSGKVLSQSVRETTADKEDLIFTVVEKPAEFSGGMTELRNFIVRELQYPIDARRNGVSGRVYVQFVVTKDGSIDKENIVILKSLYPSLDQEAVRVIKLMPNWNPGFQNGKAVNSRFVLPLNFSLPKK